MTYTTIGERSRRASQRAFLRKLARGEAYQAEAPTLWDVDDRTAVAQAELEDRELAGAYHAITFHGIDGARRHPDRDDAPRADPRVRRARGPSRTTSATRRASASAVTHAAVRRARCPVLAHPLADPEKGSGIAMICTFGDTTDVVWWRELQLPTPQRAWAVTAAWSATTPTGATDGRRTPTAALRGARGQDREAGAGADRRAAHRDRASSSGDPKPITHPVKFYERGSRPLEIVTSRQWYFRNGGREPELRAAFLARGEELHWHPPHMRQRYDSWVEGLNTDWLMSRQRFFGVPFPVWYRLDADGEPVCDEPLAARPRTSCRSTRRATCPTASPPTSATGPAASSPTPT